MFLLWEWYFFKMSRVIRSYGVWACLCLGSLWAANAAVASEALPLGSAAPKLVVTTDSGESLALDSLYKKGKLVVFFYPKALTGGCTAQACSLRDAYADLSEQGVQVIGVSRDRVALQKKFRDMYKLPFPLVSDESGEVMRAFQVREVAPGINAREAFIIADGKVVWHDKRASTRTQAEDIKRALAELN